ncbi:cell division protein FtsL [Reinekea forsetii]|nr:cell division protein FtsL [Reinekea forsetii]
MASKRISYAVLAIELLLVFATCFGLIVNTYKSRLQFALLEQVRSEQRVLEERWAKLLLEESAFSSPSRVERIARNELKMYLPGLDDIKDITEINGNH